MSGRWQWSPRAVLLSEPLAVSMNPPVPPPLPPAAGTPGLAPAYMALPCLLFLLSQWAVQNGIGILCSSEYGLGGDSCCGSRCPRCLPLRSRMPGSLARRRRSKRF